jgi:hypothetical protein
MFKAVFNQGVGSDLVEGEIVDITGGKYKGLTAKIIGTTRHIFSSGYTQMTVFIGRRHQLINGV